MNEWKRNRIVLVVDTKHWNNLIRKVYTIERIEWEQKTKKRFFIFHWQLKSILCVLRVCLCVYDFGCCTSDAIVIVVTISSSSISSLSSSYLWLWIVKFLVRNTISIRFVAIRTHQFAMESGFLMETNGSAHMRIQRVMFLSCWLCTKRGKIARLFYYIKCRDCRKKKYTRTLMTTPMTRELGKQ